MERIIEGRCHCGNIHYQLAWPADEVPIVIRECGCTFCQKHGAVYTSHPRSRLVATVEVKQLMAVYRFGHRTADFYLCLKCGGLLFAVCTLEGNDYAVINSNNFENVDPAELIHSKTDFDKESLQVRLARRRTNWTPSVTINVVG